MTRLSITASTPTTAVVDGRELIVFAGCDYLSLAHHPRVLAALERGLHEFGLSSSASRETTGNTVAHDELEHDLARFLGVEAALLAPNGYVSNLIAAQGLPETITDVLLDRESHASIRDALTATNRRAIEYPLANAAGARTVARRSDGRPLAVFTDGVFPVLHALAPLRELLEIVPAGGLLVVDDSHGTGVLGSRGRGSVELAGLSDHRIVITGTLSKALGCFGGFVAGSREVIERTRERSRAYVASTPIPPAIARAAAEALRVADEEPDRRERLVELGRPLRETLAGIGRPMMPVPYPVLTFTPAFPEDADRVSRTLREEGLLVPLVRYPDGLGAYFRIGLRADHTPEQVQRLDSALGLKVLR